MKHVTLILAAIVVCNIAHTQTSEKSIQSKIDGGNYISSTKKKEHPNNEKILLWVNDFSSPTDWVISNNTGDLQDWEITNVSSTAIGYNHGSWIEDVLTVSNENGYALFDSDAVGTSGGTQDASITLDLLQPGVDLSGYNDVVLQFAQRGTMWTTTENRVEISNDGGLTWTTFMVNVGRPASATFEDMVYINISAAAGGQSNVHIRFRYIGSWDYAWLVDDIAIIEQPINDIQSTYTYIAGTTNEGLEYGKTPLDQLDSDYEVGGTIVNFGVNDQTNTVVTADFGSFSATYPMNTVLSGDTVSYSSIETPTLTVGMYNGVYNVNSTEEFAGANYTNNTILRNFEVTNDLYALDGIGVHPVGNLNLSSIGTESFSEPANTYFATLYYLKGTNNVISGLEIGLEGSSIAGAEMQIMIMDTATFFANSLVPVQDLNSNTAISGFYVLSASEISAGKVGIGFDQPIVLPAGAYFAVAYPINSGSTPVRILDDLTVEQPSYASMINVPDPTPTSYTNGNAFAIRLKMGDQTAINEIESNSKLNIYPNPTNTNTTVSFSLSNESNVTINVTDLAGKIVYTNTLGTVNGAQNVTVNTENLTSGVYMVNVSINGTVSTEKLIVKK